MNFSIPLLCQDIKQREQMCMHLVDALHHGDQHALDEMHLMDVKPLIRSPDVMQALSQDIISQNSSCISQAMGQLWDLGLAFQKVEGGEQWIPHSNTHVRLICTDFIQSMQNVSTPLCIHWANASSIQTMLHGLMWDMDSHLISKYATILSQWTECDANIQQLVIQQVDTLVSTMSQDMNQLVKNSDELAALLRLIEWCFVSHHTPKFHPTPLWGIWIQITFNCPDLDLLSRLNALEILVQATKLMKRNTFPHCSIRLYDKLFDMIDSQDSFLESMAFELIEQLIYVGYGDSPESITSRVLSFVFNEQQSPLCQAPQLIYYLRLLCACGSSVALTPKVWTDRVSLWHESQGHCTNCFKSYPLICAKYLEALLASKTIPTLSIVHVLVETLKSPSLQRWMRLHSDSGVIHRHLYECIHTGMIAAFELLMQMDVSEHQSVIAWCYIPIPPSIPAVDYMSMDMQNMTFLSNDPTPSNTVLETHLRTMEAHMKYQFWKKLGMTNMIEASPSKSISQVHIATT